MDGIPIPSTVIDLEPETGDDLEMSRSWSHLGRDVFCEAQKRIHDLIQSASDLSDWSVAMGAEGLEPSAHVITLDGDDEPVVRIHFAFSSDMDEATRAIFATRFARLIGGVL